MQLDTAPPASFPKGRLPWYRHLYVQVLAAIVLGALLGHFQPALGESLKPLGDAFITLVKMVICLLYTSSCVYETGRSAC